MNTLSAVSILSLLSGGVCGILILGDIAALRRQKMAVMNWVWPITGVWAGPLGLWAYLEFGRKRARR